MGTLPVHYSWNVPGNDKRFYRFWNIFLNMIKKTFKKSHAAPIIYLFQKFLLNYQPLINVIIREGMCLYL